MEYTKKNKIISIFFCVVLIVMFGFLFLGHVLHISGKSMESTLRDGSYVYALKYKHIKRNDIIAFNTDGLDNKYFEENTINVKRVIGLPGDSITYTSDGRLSINGKYVDQYYLTNENKVDGTLKPKISNANFGEFNLETLSKINKWSFRGSVVPKNHYFVMGDNRSESFDSRFYGYVPQKSVIGVLF